MNTTIVRQDSTALLEKVTVGGDLSRLTPAERLAYYQRICETLALNPLTRPFQYIQLQGRLVLYPAKECAEQLRRAHGISLEMMEHRESTDGRVYIVRVRARDRDGRTDEALGAVPIEGLTPSDYANAVLRAETKAKRRVTFSICGLGWAPDVEPEDVQPVANAVLRAETKAKRRVTFSICGRWAPDVQPVAVEEAAGPTPPRQLPESLRHPPDNLTQENFVKGMRYMNWQWSFVAEANGVATDTDVEALVASGQRTWAQVWQACVERYDAQAQRTTKSEGGT